MPLSPESFPLLLNIGIFLVAAAAIWMAGTRLSRYGDVIGHRTGLGEGFVGLILLAFATSLPEFATTVTAAGIGLPELAINNLLGGIVLQTVVLALADALTGRAALTSLATRAAVLLRVTMLIILLSLALAGIVSGELALPFNIGLWAVALFAVYLVAIFLERLQRGQDNWTPVNQPEEPTDEQSARRLRHQQEFDNPTRTVAGFFVAGALVILVAGIALTLSADALSTQTGLGTSFIGVTLLALSTSLPEVSTTIGAIRIGANGMAISNVFGSNMMMVAFLLLADLFYREGTVLDHAGRMEQFTLAMGIVVSAVYLLGLIERRNRTVFRMGYDSIAVVLLYLITLSGQFFMR